MAKQTATTTKPTYLHVYRSGKSFVTHDDLNEDDIEQSDSMHIMGIFRWENGKFQKMSPSGSWIAIDACR